MNSITSKSPKQKRQPTSNCSKSNIAIAAIGCAMILLIANHWRIAVYHVHNFQAIHPILSSLSSESALWGSEVDWNADHEVHRTDRDAYILSPICGGCFRTNKSRRSCHELIVKDLPNLTDQTAILESARTVAKNNEECKICDPDSCWSRRFNSDKDKKELKETIGNFPQTKYWRFDRSGPKFTSATTLVLPSIPMKYRIPPSRFGDVGSYIREKFNDLMSNTTDHLDFLMEYNPGLAVIPEKMKAHLPKGATYLMSLRVTSANNCFESEVYRNLPKPIWDAVYHTTINHLGLALLDENYQVIPGYDIVIDLDSQLGVKRTLKKGEKSVGVTFMDYRLFVLNDEIYLHINADTVIVTKLTLSAKGFGGDITVGDKNYTDDENADLPYRIVNLFGGDQMQVTLHHQFNTVWSGGINGKNYALFSVPNSTHPNAPDSVYAELFITPNHKVQQILPDEYETISLYNVFERIWKKGTQKRRRFNIDRVHRRMVIDVGDQIVSDVAPLPSFSTVDEQWFPGSSAPFKDSAHGGACCVSFSSDDININGAENTAHPYLLVGIAHTKVSWKPWYSKPEIPQEKKDLVPHTHYVSFVYAFDPRPPFQLQARSGYFCLGFAPDSLPGDKLAPGESGIFNPYSVLTRNRPLKQYNETFECPQMHFISTFIEMANDPSKTVIGYGLNDCTSRLVEVEKKEIVRMLYPDPMDMVFEP